MPKVPKIAVKELPSNFKDIRYPDDLKVFFKPFTVKDVTTLSQITSLSDLVQELANGIEVETSDENFEALDLIVNDFYFIQTLRLINAGHDEFFIDWTCPEGHEHQYRVLAKDVDYAEVEEPNKEIEIPESLLQWFEDGIKGLVDGQLTVRRLVYLMDKSEDESEWNIGTLVGFIKRLADDNKEIVRIDDTSLSDWVNLPLGVFDLLDKNASRFTTIVNPVKLTCKTCQEEFDVELDISILIRPFR